jgi:hypothetical protein
LCLPLVATLVSILAFLEDVLESSIPDGLEWRRSSTCNGGNCVEVSARPDVVMVRNSADPDGTILAVGREHWRAWILWLRDGLRDEAGE